MSRSRPRGKCRAGCRLADGRGGPIGEEGIARQPFRLERGLYVQAAQLDGTQEDAGAGTRLRQGSGHAQPVERPWQPMNPTCVRSTVAGRPSSLMRPMSKPGAENPVHETVTR